MIRNKYIVDDKLIRGSRPNVSDIKRLKQDGVTQIICLTEKNLKEKLACKYYGITFKKLDSDFYQGKYLNYDDYQKMTKQILDNKGKTYIHCKKGLHRTSECVVAYDTITGKSNFCKALSKDLFNKNYFDYKITPQNTKIQFEDSIKKIFKKNHDQKLYVKLTESLKYFINIFKDK